MDSKRRNTLATLLTITLVFSAYQVANSLTSPTHIEVPATAKSKMESQTFGTVIVHAVMADEVVYIGWSQHAWPIAELNMSLLGESPPTRSSLDTNSSGLAELSVPPGNYSLSIPDSRIGLSIPLYITQAASTNVYLWVERSLYTPLFYELPVHETSDWINEGGRIYAKIPAGSFAFSPNSRLFIEAGYPDSLSGQVGLDNQSVVTAITHERANNSVVWLDLQIQGALGMNKIHALYLVDYRTSYSVAVRDIGNQSA